jgi:hypothetical protein
MLLTLEVFALCTLLSEVNVCATVRGGTSVLDNEL